MHVAWPKPIVGQSVICCYHESLYISTTCISCDQWHLHSHSQELMGLRTCALVRPSVVFVRHPQSQGLGLSLYICAGISSIGGTLACINHLVTFTLSIAKVHTCTLHTERSNSHGTGHLVDIWKRRGRDMTWWLVIGPVSIMVLVKYLLVNLLNLQLLLFYL